MIYILSINRLKNLLLLILNSLLDVNWDDDWDYEKDYNEKKMIYSMMSKKETK